MTMRELNIRQIQGVLLDTLVYVDGLCRKASISYYMVGGTLLGAVRHRGFIPWDDDIDIAMERSEYDRFISEWARADHEGYILQNTHTDPSCRHSLSRILISGALFSDNGGLNTTAAHNELFIDIFPLDRVPDDVGKRTTQRRNVERIKRVIGYKFSSRASTRLKHIIKRMRQILLMPITYHSLNMRFNGFACRYNGQEARCLCSMASKYDYDEQAMTREVYGKPQEMQFEGHSFLGPERPDEYLKQAYGAYMELPPEEKRFSSVRVKASEELIRRLSL